jgi:AAA domain
MSDTVIDPLQQCAEAIGILTRTKKYPEEHGDALGVLSNAMTLLNERERELIERIRSQIVDSGNSYAARTEERRAIQAIEHQEALKRRPILTRMSDIQPESVRWLWDRRIACGKLSLLVGDPGVSKSTLTIDWVARVTQGKAFPYGGGLEEPANVVMLTAEDGLADTVHGRLTLAGADLKRVHVLEGVAAGTQVQQFDLEDIPMLEAAIEQKRAALVTVDPIVAYMGEKTNTDRDSAIRRVLRPIAKLAETHRVAIIGLMHLNKSEQRQVIYRVGGSIGFVGTARSTLLIVQDPANEDRRIIGRIKGNIGRRPPDLSYVLVDHGDLSSIRWEDQVSSVKVESFIGPPQDESRIADRSDAADFLETALKSGPSSATTLIKDARKAGICERTLRDAKRKLGVADEWVERTSYWRLPTS